jgi:excisionase family DNA binding protein
MRKRTMLSTDDAAPLPLTRVSHFLEVSHVAHRLSLSEDYVRELIRTRQLAAVQIGVRYRIDPADLQAFIDARRLEASR